MTAWVRIVPRYFRPDPLDRHTDRKAFEIFVNEMKACERVTWEYLQCGSDWRIDIKSSTMTQEELQEWLFAKLEKAREHWDD